MNNIKIILIMLKYKYIPSSSYGYTYSYSSEGGCLVFNIALHSCKFHRKS